MVHTLLKPLKISLKVTTFYFFPLRFYALSAVIREMSRVSFHAGASGTRHTMQYDLSDSFIQNANYLYRQIPALTFKVVTSKANACLP